MIARWSLAWHCLSSVLRLHLTAASELTYPAVLDADANPDVALDLGWVEVDPGFGGPPFRTRGLCGSVPGPTLALSPGTTLRVRFHNRLEEQPDSYKTTDKYRFNRYGDPDVGNLHFHGGHVSGALPADDTTLAVHPGGSYDFSVPFPDDHMPGLHWVHPHHHGSSSLHLVGGAALALIVKDPPGSLPQEVEEADEKILVFNDWDIPQARRIAHVAGDRAFESSLEAIQGGEEVGMRFVTVNGMYKPTMTVERGVWQRWRILYAGWQDLPLNLKMESNGAGCELQLLAKDGIFIQDYPRAIPGAVPVPPGGRAEFMVRCADVGTTLFSAMTRDTLTVVSRDSDATMGGAAVSRNATGEAPQDNQPLALPSWQPPSYPGYLQSVMEVPPTDGCTCLYELKGYDDTSRINGETYRAGNHFMHTTYLGAVVQRELVGIDEHSYHQHVYPYQLVGGFVESEYFRHGDWHDTLLDVDGKGKSGVTTWVIRYRALDLAGKVMVHCHNTMHADSGMLAKEYVRELTDGAQCACQISGAIAGPGLIDDVDVAKVVRGQKEELDTSDVIGDVSVPGDSAKVDDASEPTGVEDEKEELDLKDATAEGDSVRDASAGSYVGAAVQSFFATTLLLIFA